MKRKPNILDTIDDKDIIDALPHGSGIDASWNVSRYDNGNVLAECSYHGMDQNGYYDGWQDFNVRLFPITPPECCPQCNGRGFRTTTEIAEIRNCLVVDVSLDNVVWIDDFAGHFVYNSCNGNYQPDVIDFKLSLSGYRQQRCWTYGLRDYLEETIHYYLSEANILKGKTNGITIQSNQVCR